MGNFHTFPVSQPARIPSPRSLVSCDKCLQPETWKPSGLQGNVFASPRSTLESLQILALISTRKPVASEDERIGSTIPMPTFARRPPTRNSAVLVDIPQSSVVGQQRQQISELQIDKFHTPQSCLSWKIRFRNQVAICSDFSSEAMIRIKEVGGDGRFNGGN